MKISIYAFVMLFLFSAFPSMAQSPGLLKSEGKIPRDFITPSTKKYKRQVKDLTDKKKSKKKKTKRKETKDTKKFLLESSFAIDDVLQSGMVLFNDPASLYVNDVLSKLPIENKKLLRKKPRVYVLNSSAVNAFATDQGIIFVTLGLLANLENEAQLAFILAHELIHVQHQHAVDKFVQSRNIDKESRNLRQVAVDRNMFKKSMYSQHLEEEADEEGLELFLKSDYDPEVILNTFKLLYYSYLPFDELEMKKSFFEDQHFILPEKLWLDSLNHISMMKEDQSKENRSSHPSSSKRMQNLKSKVADLNNAGKKAFIVGEGRFSEIQKIARYQIPFLNLYAENFAEAIYTSHLMLQEYPNDIELKKVIGKALYMESKYENSEDFSKTTIQFNEEEDGFKIEGAVHQMYNLLNEIEAKELAVLALKYNWGIYKDNTEDEELSMIINDLFIEFSKNFDNLDTFKDTAKKADAAKSTKKSSGKKKTKLEKIDASVSSSNEFWRYAFVEELNDKSFMKHYNDGVEDLKSRQKDIDFYDSAAGRGKLKRDRKKQAKQGKSLGVKKVVVVNPFYLSVDSRRNKGTDYIRSEEKQTYFSEALKTCSKASDIKAEILDVSSFSSKDVEEFNDVAKVNHYFEQQMNHYDLSLTPGYNQNEINAIAEKYGTDHFLWTGVISLRQKNNYKPLAVAFFAPYIIPFLLPAMLTPEYDMLYYAILYDVKTSRRSVIKMEYFDKRDSKSILNAHIYDVFHQINKKGKK